VTESKEHRTVSRIATILEGVAAAEPDGLPLSALAAQLDAPKSSTHDLVRGLEAIGYLTNDEGSYRIGPAPSALLNRRSVAMPAFAKPEMERLHHEFNETVSLSELVGETSVFRTMLESTQAIRYSSPLGRRNDLYPMSAGKSFLASLPRDRQVSYVTSRFGRGDHSAIYDDLVHVRTRGCSFNRQESIEGLSAIARHVGELDGTAWAISIAGPSQRIEAHFDAMEGALLESVTNLVAQLKDREDYLAPALLTRRT